MTTITGTQLLAAAAALAQRDPSQGLSTVDAARLQVFVASQLSDAWHYAPWPELLSTPNAYTLTAGAITKDSTQGRLYAVWNKDWRVNIDAKRLDAADAGATIQVLPPGHSMLYAYGSGSPQDPTVYVETWPPVPAVLTMSAASFATQTFPEFLANALAAKAAGQLLLFEGNEKSAAVAFSQADTSLQQLALPVWRSRRQIDLLKRHA